jgi:putative transcription antitermination factor YqgF
LRAEVATGVCVVQRKGTRSDIATLLPIFAQHQAQLLVVGLPFGCEGDDDSARLCRAFAVALAAAQARPVWLIDEADTTAQADAELRLLGGKAARRRRDIDMHAAKQILDRWLAGMAAERALGSG